MMTSEDKQAIEADMRVAMTLRPQAPHCSVCGQEVARCSRDAVAVVCWRCSMAYADGLPPLPPARKYMPPKRKKKS